MNSSFREAAVRTGILSIMLTSTILVAVLAMLAARHMHGGRWVMPLICVASTGFVALAAVRGGLGHWYGRLTLLGLLGCWFGDMLGPHAFLAGLAAFLAGHLGFIAAFSAAGLDGKRMLWGLLPLGLAVIGVTVWLLPHVPAGERAPVFAYVAVIGAMALFAAGASRGPAGRIAFAGALVFFLSDIFVARWRYVDPSPINGDFCYPLYYTACTLLAWSVSPNPSGNAD